MASESDPPESEVTAVDIHEFEGADVWQEDDDRARLRGYSPLSPGTPNASGASAEDLMIVSLEIEPGNYLPSHSDSNEELLVVTDGTVAVTVGESTGRLAAGQCAVVPEMVSHRIENVGDEAAHIIGFFPNDELTSTFEKPLKPFETDVLTIGDGEGE